MKTMSRKPTSPGEILNEEFLVPMGLTQKQSSDHIGCDIKVVNRIIFDWVSHTLDKPPASGVFEAQAGYEVLFSKIL